MKHFQALSGEIRGIWGWFSLGFSVKKWVNFTVLGFHSEDRACGRGGTKPPPNGWASSDEEAGEFFAQKPLMTPIPLLALLTRYLTLLLSAFISVSDADKDTSTGCRRTGRIRNWTTVQNSRNMKNLFAMCFECADRKNVETHLNVSIFWIFCSPFFTYPPCDENVELMYGTKVCFHCCTSKSLPLINSLRFLVSKTTYSPQDQLHVTMVMKLDPKWACEKHRGENGDIGHCWINPNGNHTGLNMGKKKMWASALVSWDLYYLHSYFWNNWISGRRRGHHLRAAQYYWVRWCLWRSPLLSARWWGRYHC
jgi:hypothetical protein